MSTSTSSGLSRTRSLRQPANRGNEPGPTRGGGGANANTAAAAAARNELRNTSPSRLPVTKPLTRSATTASSSSSVVTGRTRASSTTTGTGAGAGGSSRPLSGVFSGRNATGRRTSPTASGEPTSTTTTTTTAAAKPLGRAPSTRKLPPLSTTTAQLRKTSASAAAAAAAAASDATTSSSRTRKPSGSSGGGGVPPSPTTASSRPPTSAPRQAGHTRARSAVTSLTAATTLRPLSTQSSSSSGTTATNTSNTNNTGGGGTSSPKSAHFPPGTGTSTGKPHTRSQTLHTRAQSQSYSNTSNPNPNPNPPPTTTTASNSKPAFSTHQQHYSPAKQLAPKPLTSTFLAPPSPSKLPANVALSAETSRLQSELLQLALLRREAGPAEVAWRASARRKLGARRARLAAEDAKLVGAERGRAEGRNVDALLRWGEDGRDGGSDGKGGRRRSLDEKIQLLDEVVTGVWGLGGNSDHHQPSGGGRYARAVRAFEDWVEEAAAVLEAQQRGGSGGGRDEGAAALLFLSDLDDSGWKGECAGLVRRLEGYRVSLRELGGAVVEGDDEDEDEPNDGGDESSSKDRQQRSGLAQVLGGCRSLVHGMLAELDAMEQIGREAAAAEDEWIERMSRQLKVDGDESPGHQRDLPPPLWKLAI